jgi:hypothetical protein
MIGILMFVVVAVIAALVRLGLVFLTAWILKLFWKSKWEPRVKTGVIIWVLIEGALTIWMFADLFAPGVEVDTALLRNYATGTFIAVMVYVSIWNQASQDEKTEAEEIEDTF